MDARRVGVWSTAVVIIGLSTLALVAQQSASPSAPPAPAPRQTPWGEPNLQGIWSLGTLTPMERPVRWADKAVLTPEEAAAYADSVTNRPGGTYGRDAKPRPGTSGSYNEIFSEYGGDTAQQLDRGRTSLIIDPPDGRMPPYSAEGIARENRFREWQRTVASGDNPRVNDLPPDGMYNASWRGASANGPESRGTQERCFGEPLPYDTSLATFVRIVQSPGHVVLYLDRHQGRGDVRVVQIGRKEHLPSHIRLIHGDSIGWWEGDTLVVDTTNFSPKMEYRGARENLHLVERFTRGTDGRIIWRVTVEDRTTWTRPWTFEVCWNPRSDKENQIYEQSCHEGNFGIIGLLAGRRHQERLHAEGKAAHPDLLNREGGRPALIGPDGRVPPNVGSSVPDPDSLVRANRSRTN
jgi:hypothetical protein